MDPNEWADSAVVEEAPIPTPPETKAAAETPSVQPAVQAAPHPKIDPKALRTQARMAQALHDVYYGGKAPGSDYEQDFLARVKFAQDKISAGDFDDGPTSDQYFRSLAQYHYHQQRAQGLTPKFDQSDLNLKKEVQNLKLASMIAERQQSGWHDARMAQQQRNVVSGMPVVGAVGLGLNDRRKTKELEESVARFEQGEADDIDLSRMANAHAAGEFEKGQGKLAKIGDFMPKLLAMYGEAMMLPGGGFLRAGAAPTMSAFGGQLSRGAMMSMGPRTAAQLALTTAAMPSMYAESAIGQNTAEGRAAFDPRGFGSAGAHTMAQLAVLGVVGKGAQGVIGKFLPNAGLTGETAATAAMAPFTMAATELVTNAAGIDTGWGTFGHLWRGEGDAAIVKAATDMLTFGTLHAVNNAGQPRYRPLDMKAFADALKEAKQRGFSAQAAAALASARMNPAPGKSPGELMQGSANKLIQDRANRYGVDHTLAEDEVIQTNIGPMPRSQAMGYGLETESPEKTLPGKPLGMYNRQPVAGMRQERSLHRYDLHGEPAPPVITEPATGKDLDAKSYQQDQQWAHDKEMARADRLYYYLKSQGYSDAEAALITRQEAATSSWSPNRRQQHQLPPEGMPPGTVMGPMGQPIPAANPQMRSDQPMSSRPGSRMGPMGIMGQREGQTYTDLPAHWQNRRNPMDRPPEPPEPDAPVPQGGPPKPPAPATPEPQTPFAKMMQGVKGWEDATPETRAAGEMWIRIKMERDVANMRRALTRDYINPGELEAALKRAEDKAFKEHSDWARNAFETYRYPPEWRNGPDAVAAKFGLKPPAPAAPEPTTPAQPAKIGLVERMRQAGKKDQPAQSQRLEKGRKWVESETEPRNLSEVEKAAIEHEEGGPHQLSPAWEALRLEIESRELDTSALDAREKQVFEARRPQPDRKQESLRSIGRRMGLSYEAVRLIEKSALEKLGQQESASAQEADIAAENELDRTVRDIGEGRIVNPEDLHHRPEDVHARSGDQISDLKARDHAGQIVLEKYEQEIANARRQGLAISQEREAFWAERFADADAGRLSAKEAQNIEVGGVPRQAGSEAPPSAEAQGRGGVDLPPSEVHPGRLNTPEIKALRKKQRGGLKLTREEAEQVRRANAAPQLEEQRMRQDGYTDEMIDMAHWIAAQEFEANKVSHQHRSTEAVYKAARAEVERVFAERAKEQAEEAERRAAMESVPEEQRGDVWEGGERPKNPDDFMVFGGIPVPPAVTKFVNSVLKWAFTNRSVDNVPPVRIDRDHLLPRLQSWGDDKLIASDPHELGKLGGLGKIADPRARAEAPEDQAIVGWAYGYSKAESLAALWRASQHEYAGKLFQTAPDGKRIILSDGTYGYMADVAEKELKNPGSQKLSDAERAWLNDIWKPLSADMRAFIEENGIKYHDENGKELKLNEFFFPRTAIGKEGVEDTTTKGNARHGRLYESEEAGATGNEKILYDMDFLSRVSKQYAAIYHAYYDKMLASDPALRGETVKERFEALKERHADEIAGLEGRELRTFLRDLRERANHVVTGKEARVDARPGFYGKIYPAEVAKKLNAMFGETGYGWIKGVQNVARQSQAAVLALDVSAPMNQLLPLLFTNPIKWASLYPKMVKSWFDPEIAHRMLSHPEYMNAAQRFVQGGGTLFRFHDFLEGAKKGEWVTRLPFGVGKFYEKSAHAMGVAMDIAKLERFMAEDAKGIAPKDLAKTIESIENSLGMGRMRQIGVSEGQMALERIFLALAPSYYRAAAGHIGGAISAMPSLLSRKPLPAHERVALRSLGHFMAGITAFSVAAMIAAGLDMDEITDRLKPWKGKFLKVPIDFLGTEVGLGNIVTSMLRLAGDAIEWHFDPNPINTGVDGNPWLRFYRSHAPAGPKFGIDAATGKDFNNERQTLTKSAVKSALPVAVQQGVLPSEEGETAGQRAAQAVFSFFGMTAFPKRDSYAENLNQTAKRMTGLSYEDLNLKQQEKVVKATERVPSRFTPAMAERMEAYRQARQQLLMNDLSKSSRMNLAEVARQVPAYNRSVSQGGKTIPLNDRQVKEYHDYLVEEYDREIGRWNMSSLMAKSGAAREKFVNSSLETARKKARARLR